MLFISIMLAALVACTIAAARRMMSTDVDNPFMFTDGYLWPASIGLVVGIINLLLPNFDDGLSWVSWICLAIMLGLSVWLILWWKAEGGELKEIVPFAALALLFAFATHSVAEVAAGAVTSPVMSDVVVLMPTIVFVGTIGFFFSNLFYFCYAEIDEYEEDAKRHKELSGIAIVAMVVISAFLLATSVDWSLSGDSSGGIIPTSTSTETTAKNGIDSRFVQKWTSNKGNRLDANFASKLVKKAGGAAITPNIVKEAVLENCGHDARQLAIWANAFKLWPDPNDYQALVTSDKKYLSDDGISLYNKLEGYMAATHIKREKAPSNGVNSGYDGQFVFASIGGISGDRAGTKFESPDPDVKEFWLMDRCSNLVYEGVRPAGVPTGKTDNPKPPKGKGNPKPGKPDNPTTPKYNKDPNKAPKKNTEPNDDKGPGPNTNNPKDPKHSSKDTKDSSSNSGKSYKEYKEGVQEKAKINKEQKTGSDSNKPSTPAPKPSTNVDNNGDKGTGNGGINKPTPVQPKPKEADTGKEIKDSPGEAWEGPSD